MHPGMIPVKIQLDAQFFMYIYFHSLHVSGSHVPIIRRIIVSMRHLFYVSQVNLQHTVTHTHIFALKILQLPQRKQLPPVLFVVTVVTTCLVCGNCSYKLSCFWLLQYFQSKNVCVCHCMLKVNLSDIN